ncbi:MAG: hypothetical protein FD152_886, partial [Xanthobacteraceae bacterium]
RTLDRDQPTRFPGAPAPFCRLRDGASATAFNLLTRDGAATGDVSIRRGHAAEEPVPSAGIVVLYALEEAWSLTADGEAVVVHQGAAAQVEGASALAISSAIGGRAAVVTIDRG